MSETRGTELIFIPLTMLSHLTTSFEVATLLTERDETLTVTFLIMKLPPMDPKVSSFIKNNNHSSHYPRISFVELEPEETTFQKLMSKLHPKTLIRRLIKSQTGLVRDHVAAEKTRRIGGFVVDVLCTCMIDVAGEFNIPAYVFFPCSSSGLGLLFHLQTFAEDNDPKNLKQYEDSDFEVSVPTFARPVPARVWPDDLFEEGADACFLDMARGLRKAKGIVVNTFVDLESRAIESLSDDPEIPPVYPIGPILHLHRSEENKEKRKEIVSWLDNQPDSSVIYICFGSAGFLEPEQVKEIATAIENSGHKFLWSLRKPPRPNTENPREVLPLGFLERTSGIGKIIGWAPQMTVLSHRAVGGFVSHCGWNSTLESIWCGVPMAALPLFAEQQLNAFQLVKELGIAAEVKMDYRRDGGAPVVGSDMIERAVRELMDSGKDGIRVRARALKEKSRLAGLRGGSSYEFLGTWIDDFMDI